MITSNQNQRIKETRKLQQRRYRQAAGCLLLEGYRLIHDAFVSGASFRELYFAPALIADHPNIQALLMQVEQSGIEVIACTPQAFAALTETVTPQGVAATVFLPNLPLPAAPTFTLILDQVRDPGNAGALLRSAEAAGVELALFAADTVDPYNEKAMRAGMGAHFRLPIRICQTWQAVTALLNPAQQLYIAEAAAALPYDEIDWRQPAAVIIGGEATGASHMARSVAHAMTIPMLGHVESLNAAIAGAVILFEAARQRRHTK